jgi:hypothetical protein
MDASFIPIETVPSKTPFGLDQLRRSYKTALSAEDAIAAAPSVGEADESFPNMFLMPITTPESAESATRIDLVYMGSLQGAEGDPTLPAQKHDADTAVQSSSSSRASDGRTATSPVTIQYYAPTTTLSYFSFGAPGTDIVDDPTDDAQIISVVVGDLSLTIGSVGVQELVDAFFTSQILETHSSSEIVPGQYWQNQSQKLKNYTAFIANAEAGAYLSLYSTGTGYTVGDTLTISFGGESAVIDITVVGVSDSVVAWTETSNTFTADHTALTASGGTGSGARFNVFIIA